MKNGSRLARQPAERSVTNGRFMTGTKEITKITTSSGSDDTI